MSRTIVLTKQQVASLCERTATRGRTFVMTESQVDKVAEIAKMTEWKFVSNIKKFLHDLLTDPMGAIVPNTLALNGCNKSGLIRKLMSNDLLRKEQRINDTDTDGNPTKAVMMVKYLVPKKNFYRKLKTLYIKMFESNLPSNETLTEDGEGGCAMGATTCDASSGQFTATAFGVQRRQIAEEELDETTTCGSVGPMQYDAPAFGDKESLKRHNGVGGSVSVNQA
ncbi:MAG: hypothetical protein LUD72_07475 [Bacteroidales bacterium]|nr:hypothetical protein [Bacteroidales bacterium]